jgi:hypothetical protein
MTNLLAETLNDIKELGYVPEDIIFIGSRKSGHQCTWGEFANLADVEYDESYGAQKVATDLEIVFSDGSGMQRGEYDGSEWWTYFQPFTPPAVRKPITRLVCTGMEVGWISLPSMHGEEPEPTPWND